MHITIIKNLFIKPKKMHIKIMLKNTGDHGMKKTKEDYMMILNGPLKKDGSVQAHVAQMLHGKKLQYYTDPETGLHAINHFVLY